MVDGVQKLKCLNTNLHLKADQSSAYADKIGYLIEAAGQELALKIFVLAGLISTLLESVDNILRGGFSKKGSHLAMDDIHDSIAELVYYRKFFIQN